MDLNTLLDALKVAVGLLYLYLEYNARRGLWIVGVIMPAIGIWLFYNKGLYADCAINVYYLAIAAYGWLAWSRRAGRAEKPQLAVSHIGAVTAAWLLAAWLAVWGAIAALLSYGTDSTVPLLDSLTTSLSLVGMWMLARKYAEQWLVWFVVDGFYVYLYYYKGIYFSGTLYAFYTVMALLGYRKWLRLIPRPQPGAEAEEIGGAAKKL